MIRIDIKNKSYQYTTTSVDGTTFKIPPKPAVISMNRADNKVPESIQNLANGKKIIITVTQL